MSEGPSDSSNLSNSHLEPPRRTTELQDPGAAISESDDEHFSDASEGIASHNSQPPSGRTSPVPRTRVERVDSSTQHGEVPGTAAFDKRTQDAVPDEIEIVPEGAHGQGHSHNSQPPSGRSSPVPRTRVERVDSSTQHGEVPGTAAFEKRAQDAVPDEMEIVPEGVHSPGHSPAGSEDQQPVSPESPPIPRTVVEKVDPGEPSHGEVPGTLAHEKRLADAVPDVVTKASDSEGGSPTTPAYDATPPETEGSTPDIPETHLERVDSIPDEDLPPHPHAHVRSSSDALPDTVETVPDTSITDTNLEPQDPSSGNNMNDDHGYEHQQAGGDDFDEFVEEQEDMEDDDFGDFDDGFQEPSTGEPLPDGIDTPQQTHAPPPPLIDFDSFKSTSELLDTLQDTLNTLFPATQDLSSLPALEPIPDSSAIFSTDRSLSLWSQLVAPPPLQPQNWVKSRIRRLFLVSLGVPVDLDEILPASKQKKLVLPSVDLEGTGPKSPGARSSSQARKEEGDNANADKGQAPSRHKTTSRRGAPPAPEIDLNAVRRLCATTDAALSGLTDAELKLHVQELEQAAQRASFVLEHWLKRRDGLIGEKEAFEGVIENLVSHVRRVRK
ncbi:hypothetical protein N7535_000490 [Penicillium sp. DV-2018c]|nr:hypothetical protein N7535_000490 [Penicillium sp. DV-2018c]